MKLRYEGTNSPNNNTMSKKVWLIVGILTGLVAVMVMSNGLGLLAALDFDTALTVVVKIDRVMEVQQILVFNFKFLN